MWEMMGAPQALPFSVALVLMVGIGLLEGVSTLLGAAASSLIDALLPDFDADLDLEVDIDTDADIDTGHVDVSGSGFLTQTLSWLRVGQVPVLILLTVFLAAFGTIGLLGQTLLAQATGMLLPAWIASIPVFFVSLPVVRAVGGGIARILPKEETTAVSSASFVGRVARIVMGTARRGEPTQARLRDEHGRRHYVLVEPDIEGQEFGQGDPVLLVSQDGARFRVIAPPSDALLREQSESHDGQ